MLQLSKYYYSASCLRKCLELQNLSRPICSVLSAASSITEKSQIGEAHTISIREISTTACLMGKRNFRKFHLGNKRGSRRFKEERNKNPDKYPDMPAETEVKPIGYRYGKDFIQVPEMIPEIIVPDLKDCNLKPYVSYRTADIHQEEFTAKELFTYIYQVKIEQDFKNGKLDADGNSTEPSDEEKLDAEKAFLLARRTGSDIFSERIPKLWECLDDYKLEETKQDRTVYPPVYIPVTEVKNISEKE